MFPYTHTGRQKRKEGTNEQQQKIKQRNTDKEKKCGL